jgi:hypothetical protein
MRVNLRLGAERQGRPPAADLRHEFASDQFYALARVRLGTQPLTAEAAKVGDAITAGIAAQGSPDDAVRAKGRGQVTDAIGAFQVAVELQTAGRERFGEGDETYPSISGPRLWITRPK